MNLQVCIKESLVYNKIKSLPVILPSDKWKIIADFWITCLIIYRMFIVTIKYAYFFNNIPESTSLVNMYVVVVINISYIIDVLLNLNTGYYEKGIIITDKKKIARHYL